MGIDPVTHKSFSHLMAEIATTLAPPQVAHLAEAALGCFKDEMFHLLTKKRTDFQLQQSAPMNTTATYITNPGTLQEQCRQILPEAAAVSLYLLMDFTTAQHHLVMMELHHHHGARVCVLEVEAHVQPEEQQRRLHEKVEDDNCEESEGGKEIRNGFTMYNTDYVLWDLPSDDLMNPIV
ncbi:hypothetical protein Patl1_03807 [Pistacia atlantica]|uniref:Uncharacterized protein n=1 Tax=Pistacia atlantica TaxID=434234 RepID=A0ACC1BR35_9ROSI|nr:hypothetical protein Patl1_03807 [Pistacia atlantica]